MHSGVIWPDPGVSRLLVRLISLGPARWEICPIACPCFLYAWVSRTFRPPLYCVGPLNCLYGYMLSYFACFKLFTLKNGGEARLYTTLMIIQNRFPTATREWEGWKLLLWIKRYKGTHYSTCCLPPEKQKGKSQSILCLPLISSLRASSQNSNILAKDNVLLRMHSSISLT